MTASNPQHEPTMEEILASIRRIISDDESAAPAPEPVLELTNPAPEPMADMEPEVELDAFDRVDEPGPEPAMEMVEEPDDFMVEMAPEPPAPAPKPVMASGLMSERPAGAAAQSFAKLVGAMAISGHPSQTLEDVVKDLLRPLLQEWLDTNLPAIVEAEVAAELTRITRMGRP